MTARMQQTTTKRSYSIQVLLIVAVVAYFSNYSSFAMKIETTARLESRVKSNRPTDF